MSLITLYQVEKEVTGAVLPEVDVPASWGWIHSSRVFDFVTSGSRGWAKYYSETGPIFLRVGNLDHDTIEIDLSDVQRVSPPPGAEGLRTRVARGDLLISITADVGMVSLVDGNLGEAYINQHVALARPNGRLNPRYLAYFLASRNGQEQFLRLQRGATKVGLGLDDIRGVWVAHPPDEEQKEIVRRIEMLLGFANRLQDRFEHAKTQLDRLPLSVLAKAFRGELVPNEAELAAAEGRTFESAEELLARIRSAANNIVDHAARKPKRAPKARRNAAS